MSIVSANITGKSGTKNLFYDKKGLWNGFVSADFFKTNTFSELLNILNKKYEKLYILKINNMKTYSNSFIKPKDIYPELDINNFYAIFVVKDGHLKLLTTAAKRAKEFVKYNTTNKFSLVPLFVYKNKETYNFVNLK